MMNRINQILAGLTVAAAPLTAFATTPSSLPRDDAQISADADVFCTFDATLCHEMFKDAYRRIAGLRVFLDHRPQDLQRIDSLVSRHRRGEAVQWMNAAQEVCAQFTCGGALSGQSLPLVGSIPSSVDCYTYVSASNRYIHTRCEFE